MALNIQRGTCKNCGQAIYRMSTWAQKVWAHVDSDLDPCAGKRGKYAEPQD